MLVPIQNQQTPITTQLSAYGTLQQAIETLQTAGERAGQPSRPTTSRPRPSSGEAMRLPSPPPPAPRLPRTRSRPTNWPPRSSWKSGAIANRTQVTLGHQAAASTVTLADGTGAGPTLPAAL